MALLAGAAHALRPSWALLVLAMAIAFATGGLALGACQRTGLCGVFAARLRPRAPPAGEPAVDTETVLRSLFREATEVPDPGRRTTCACSGHQACACVGRHMSHLPLLALLIEHWASMQGMVASHLLRHKRRRAASGQHERMSTCLACAC